MNIRLLAFSCLVAVSAFSVGVVAEVACKNIGMCVFVLYVRVFVFGCVDVCVIVHFGKKTWISNNRCK
jgi:hypothetical protein